MPESIPAPLISDTLDTFGVPHDLGNLRRRLRDLLKAAGPVFVELRTGLAEQTPMSVRERTPFHQQRHDVRVKPLHPRAPAGG